MHDDALKALWRTQRIEPAPLLPDARQMAEMRHHVNCLNRTLFWRDVRESIAAIVVMVCFGIYFFIFPAPLARIGCAIEILSSLLVIVYPIWRKRRVAKAAPDASMMQSLGSELRNVEVEIALLRSILWWYILPLSLGGVVFLAGLDVSFTSTILFLLIGIALDAFVYWINQIAVDKKLLPLKRELDSLLRVDDSIPPPEPPGKYTMPAIIMLICGLLFVGFIGYLIAKGLKAEVYTAGDYSDPTSQMLETIRVKHKLPALAAAVIVNGKIVATNAVGFRRHGEIESVTANDKFHIGSVTKSMTATVAAMLVEQGKISWTTTIGELFPEHKDLHPDYRGVTLEQLLAHRGGAPKSPPMSLWRKAWSAGGTPAEQRIDFVKGILAHSPEEKPGTKHIYSNQGYAIAGVMLEKAAGKPWEELMRTMLFEPLGMKTAGFGAPATPGKTDQPWGHSKGLFFGNKSVPPGPRADNPPAIGPAGTVHCSLADLAEYALFHMAGARGSSRLLKADSFTKLHTSAGDDYALGWVVLKRDWARGPALMHNGSNTMFYLVVWMAPELNCAVIVATNSGRESAPSGCDEAASSLINQFFPTQKPQ